MPRYAATLLDLDGTLVDSNDAHAHAWIEALAHHGIPVPVGRVRGMIYGGPADLLARWAGSPLGEPSRPG